MAVLSINYDLRAPGRDYGALYNLLRSFTHIHDQGSLWFVETSRLPTDIRDMLRQYVDANDKLFVATIQRNWASVNSPAMAEWLNSPIRNWH